MILYSVNKNKSTEIGIKFMGKDYLQNYVIRVPKNLWSKLIKLTLKNIVRSILCTPIQKKN